MCPTPNKYPELLDKAWVLEQRKTKSMKQIADEVGCSPSSVRWVVERYLADEKKGMKYDRKPHTNKKTASL